MAKGIEGTAFPLDLMPNWRLPSQLGFGPGMQPDPYALGDLWVRRHREGPNVEYITVNDDASPQVLIGDELLRDIQFDIRRYNTSAWVTLENLWDHTPSDCPTCTWAKDHLSDRPSHCFSGMLMLINARNRQLIYRIGQYRPQSRTWEATWPD
jgi:hypothetical protein